MIHQIHIVKNRRQVGFPALYMAKCSCNWVSNSASFNKAVADGKLHVEILGNPEEYR